jgi:hypothetical protein
MIAVGRELVGARGALFERFVAVALQHQGGGAPDIDLGDRADERRKCGLGADRRLTPIIAFVTNLRVKMAAMAALLTAKDVVRRIAAECA